MQLIRSRQDSRSTLGMFVLVSLGAQGVIVFTLLLLFGAYVGLARKAPPSLVQLEGGRSITVEPMDNKDRTPAVIQKFVQDEATALLSVSGKIFTGDVKNPAINDPGVAVDGNNKKITTLAKVAGFGLSEDFRPAFLRSLADLTPQEAFSAQVVGAQKALIIQDISEPQKVGDGKWKVTVIASLVKTTGLNQIGEAVAWNKDVFVQAVPAPDVTPQASDLEKQIAQSRQSGLEIYAVRDYLRPNL